MANTGVRERRKAKSGAEDNKNQAKDSKKQKDASGTRKSEETNQSVTAAGVVKSLLIYAVVFTALTVFSLVYVSHAVP